MKSAVANEHEQGWDFEKAAMPYVDSLYNTAYRMTRNSEDAEDLVQETYLKALRAYASFQAGTNFRAWMFRILRNAFLNSRTGQMYKTAVSLDSDEPTTAREAVAAGGTPESDYFRVRNRAAIAQAIESLPLPFREVLLLSDVEEMSYADIATTLALPIGTVTSRLGRARRRLREILRDDVVRE